MQFDPQDPVTIQQEQAEQQRRLQQADQQRRQDLARQTEDGQQQERRRQEAHDKEELERLERELEQERLEEEEAADGERRLRDAEHTAHRRGLLAWLQGRGDASGDSEDDRREAGEQSDDEELDDEERELRDRPLSPPAASGGGTATGIILVAAVAVLGLGYVSYQWFGPHSNTETESVPPVAAKGLPRATDDAPTAPSVVPQDGGDGGTLVASDRSQDAFDQAKVLVTDAQAAIQAASASGESALADPLPNHQQALATTKPMAPTAAITANSVAAGTPSTEAAVAGPSSPTTQELTQRVADLEKQLAHEKARTTPSDRAHSTLVAKRSERPRTLAAVRHEQRTPSSKPAQPKPAVVPAVPALQAELLAIDMWDGRPSVVVGTNAPGDKRVRTLQPGEPLHGITLKSADAQAGRATFITSSGELITLNLTSQGAHP